MNSSKNSHKNTKQGQKIGQSFAHLITRRSYDLLRGRQGERCKENAQKMMGCVLLELVRSPSLHHKRVPKSIRMPSGSNFEVNL